MDLGGSVKRASKAKATKSKLSVNTFYKPKTDLIDYENWKIDTWYALTLNPSDKYQHFESGSRLATVIKELTEVLCLYSHLSFQLWLEVSKKGRLHWHGYCKTEEEKDKNLFFIHGLPRLLRRCTMVIRDINDDVEWDKYVHKQWQFHNYVLVNHYTPMPIERIRKKSIDLSESDTTGSDIVIPGGSL